MKEGDWKGEEGGVVTVTAGGTGGLANNRQALKTVKDRVTIRPHL